MGPINTFTEEHFFLSNFYSHSIAYEGITYPSSEHAYQAAKTLDHAERLHISQIPSEGKAKKAGQKVTLRKDWESVKLKVMKDILRIKFANPGLRSRLIETGDRELIEGNTWNDTFWGVCRGHGKNMLGHLLMEVREELK